MVAQLAPRVWPQRSSPSGIWRGSDDSDSHKWVQNVGKCRFVARNVSPTHATDPHLTCRRSLISRPPRVRVSGFTNRTVPRRWAHDCLPSSVVASRSATRDGGQPRLPSVQHGHRWQALTGRAHDGRPTSRARATIAGPTMGCTVACRRLGTRRFAPRRRAAPTPACARTRHALLRAGAARRRRVRRARAPRGAAARAHGSQRRGRSPPPTGRRRIAAACGAPRRPPSPGGGGTRLSSPPRRRGRRGRRPAGWPTRPPRPGRGAPA